MCEIIYADTFFKHFKGLMLKKDFDGVMVFTNLTSADIHSCFMRFSIDVYFLDDDKRIIDKTTLKPWRYYKCRMKVSYIVETKEKKLKLKIGDILDFI